MKIHLSGIRVTAAAVVVAVGISGGLAVGQYIPYSGVPQYSNAAPYGAQTQQPYGTQPQQQPAYQPTQQQANTPARPGTRQPVLPSAGSPYAARPQYQPPRYQTPQAPTTVAAQPWSPRPSQPTVNQQPVAQQPYGQQPMNIAMSQNSEALPTPEPAMNSGVMGSSVMNGQVMNGQPSYDGGYSGYQEGGTNCSSPYPTTGSYGGYVEGGYGGGYSNCGPDYGVSQYFGSECGGTQWFGGVYYLFMNRDNPDFKRLTIQVEPAAYPYYPPADVTVLQMPHADHDYRSGFEVRFGSTFTVGGPSCDTGCDPYGYGYGDSRGYGGGYSDCGSGCPQQDYAWEIGYWFLDDDINEAVAIDAIPTDDNRMYGMKNFAGLEYDRDGAGAGGYRPVNHYYDYQMPVRTPGTPWPPDDVYADDIRVLAQRVRTNFSAQNLELNFLRLPIVCGSSCGYNSCGNDQCGGYGSCEPVACSSPFTITGLCGIRYIRLDDDVEYATKFADWAAGPVVTPPAYTPFDYMSDNELFYDVNVDNHLTGFQFGANMNYCVSCKCNVFWDTNFGLYNNHMKSYQRVYSGGGGPVRFQNGGADADVNSDKDDIAFVGEMRLGGSYDFSCHWRGILAYRAVAINGVALSVDQMPEDFANYEQTALIDSDGSIVIHGVQVGAECRY